MNRNHLVLLALAILTLPLIYFFIPDSEPGTIKTLEGVVLSTVAGQKFKLSSIFAEKPILLVFWSVRCGSCIEEIPFIIRLHENYNDRMTIIGVHPPGFPQAVIQKFLKKYPQKIPYMVAVDDEMSLCNAYEASVLPKVVLLNTRAEVLYSHVGFDPGGEKEMENAILAKLAL